MRGSRKSRHPRRARRRYGEGPHRPGQERDEHDERRRAEDEVGLSSHVFSSVVSLDGMG